MVEPTSEPSTNTAKVVRNESKHVGSSVSTCSPQANVPWACFESFFPCLLPGTSSWSRNVKKNELGLAKLVWATRTGSGQKTPVFINNKTQKFHLFSSSLNPKNTNGCHGFFLANFSLVLRHLNSVFNLFPFQYLSFPSLQYHYSVSFSISIPLLCLVFNLFPFITSFWVLITYDLFWVLWWYWFINKVQCTYDFYVIFFLYYIFIWLCVRIWEITILPLIGFFRTMLRSPTLRPFTGQSNLRRNSFLTTLNTA